MTAELVRQAHPGPVKLEVVALFLWADKCSMLAATAAEVIIG